MNNISKAKNDVSNILQIEANKKINEELLKKLTSTKLQEKFEKAAKIESDIKNKKLAELSEKARKFEEIQQKIRQKVEEDLKMQEEMQKKQIEKLEKKSQKKAELEEAIMQKHREKNMNHMTKVQQIREQKLQEMDTEVKNQMNILKNIEKERIFMMIFILFFIEALRQEKGDQYLKLASAMIEHENSISTIRVAEKRKFQLEAEKKARKEYRQMQNLILKTIISNKSRDYQIHKNKTKVKTQEDTNNLSKSFSEKTFSNAVTEPRIQEYFFFN